MFHWKHLSHTRPATGIMQTPMQSALCAVSGTSIKATAQKTRPRLSDVFTAQVPDIPALSAVTGLVQMPSVTLGPAPARPSVTFGVDFIQINCGKRISAMTLLEANTKNKIALIQEPLFWKSALIMTSRYPRERAEVDRKKRRAADTTHFRFHVSLVYNRLPNRNNVSKSFRIFRILCKSNKGAISEHLEA
jgi:hypothetical protein